MSCASEHEPLICKGAPVEVGLLASIGNSPQFDEAIWVTASICGVCGAVYVDQNAIECATSETFKDGGLHG